ncbi:hypothetical protein DQ04_01631040 [Trypanosoma grayi]|uniref:hypothetical protein n=1 Tax=Trypanosoma grayi TaxID=71804 RepID=UPI0004F43815|nr:hypothetical protein DQ04_01631040 [Trypanosoma grayi]KEG12538.1 hypothetical protein DQ04_01631040 [Trypanosoma grayi]
MSENVSSKFCARTALLQQLLETCEEQQKQQRAVQRWSRPEAVSGERTEAVHTAKSDSEDDGEESDNNVSTAVWLMRNCAPLTNPSWAMEELQRIHRGTPVWAAGTQLSSAVWAPPGTANCPFGTKPTDFLRHS